MNEDAERITRDLDPTSRGDLKALGGAMRAIDGHAETVEHLLGYLGNAGAAAAVEGNTRLVIRVLTEFRHWMAMELAHNEKADSGDVIDADFGPYDIVAETIAMAERINEAIRDAEAEADREKPRSDLAGGSNGQDRLRGPGQD